MFFRSIDAISDKKEAKLLKEQVQVYIRLVEVYCEINNTTIPGFCNDEKSVIEEMINIGIINSPEEVDCVEAFLGASVFKHFKEAVSFAIKDDGIKKYLYKLSNKQRKKLQEEAAKETRLSLVDFFCGAGGLSLGFIQEGFQVKLANDIEDVCVHTYMYNHPELPSNKMVQGDIKQIVDNVAEYIDCDIDIVVGGPPCQGFSEANRQRVIDDPRNKLYKYFVQAVENIAPKFVVMENVKGMLKVADQVVEDYGNINVVVNGKNCSYLVAYKILNSADFSVAQARERLIYIAIRSDIAEKENIKPEDIFLKIEESCKNSPKFVLEDALKDIRPLDAPRVKNMNEIDSDTTGKKIDINAFEINDNLYLSLINQNRQMPFLFNHKARYLSDVNYEIYKRLNQGDDATDEKIADIMPYAHRNHCFKDKYYKLIADRPCRTITAHLRMDCHSHIHPYQIRALSPREAARVQSFPDDYLFWGAYLKTYMQIGNAVPPMMARGIARIIKGYL